MEAILPTEIATPIPRDGLLTTATNNSEIAHDLDTVDESRELAKIIMASYQQKMSNSYNKNVYIRTFAVRDLVLRKVFQNTMDMNGGNFATTWERPYLIDSIVGRGAYRLFTLDGIQVPRSWNSWHLKKYHM